MAKVTTYQCPACTGPLHFDSKLNKLKCDYCDSVFEVAEIDKLYEEKVQAAKEESEKETEDAKNPDSEEEAEYTGNGNWDASKVKMYNCSTCGAELLCDVNTVATSCPYCGNPTVIPGQFTGGVMPDVIIPFKFDKNSAIQALKKHYNGKKFLPKVFSTENHIEEVKGVYVPFWLFDGVAHVDMKFAATRTHAHVRGKEEVVTTEHYLVERKASVPFEKIPVDASEKMDDAEMDSIEPFNYSDLVPFTTSYLPGYFAESYDVEQKECESRLKLRVENSSYEAVTNDVIGYQTVTCTGKSINIKKNKIHYAFLPVWILNTKWKEKNYQFVMNGQTGKLVGNLPVDKGLFCKYFFSIAAGCSVVLSVLFYFLLK